MDRRCQVPPATRRHVPKAAAAFRSQPRRIRSTQAPTLGLDQSDQSRAIVVNVPAIRAARIASRNGDRDGPSTLPRPRRASSWTLISTRTPRMPQNRASGTLKPQTPRSQ